MLNLPLFPLNTVLFPGMPLRLHIFEDRYQRMVRECLETDRAFGVVLIRRGEEALGPLAEPYLIGCSARIVHTEHLQDGRMNILVLGQERFRVVALDSESASYLIGQVEPFPLGNPNPQTAVRLGERLRPWVERYMQLLEDHSKERFLPEHLPRDPSSLAYLAAILLQVPAGVKQELLMIPETADLLDKMHAAYLREVALLKTVLLDRGTRTIGAFSEN